MEAKTHVVSYYNPEIQFSTFDHLVFGDDRPTTEAFAQARAHRQALDGLTDLLVFIERTEEPATTRLDCNFCNDRKNRQDYLLH